MHAQFHLIGIPNKNFLPLPWWTPRLNFSYDAKTGRNQHIWCRRTSCKSWPFLKWTVWFGFSCFYKSKYMLTTKYQPKMVKTKTNIFFSFRFTPQVYKTRLLRIFLEVFYWTIPWVSQFIKARRHSLEAWVKIRLNILATLEHISTVPEPCLNKAIHQDVIWIQLLKL